jgi:hypothetical protein
LIFSYGDFGGIRAAFGRFLRFPPCFESFLFEKGLGYHKPIL